MTWLALLLLQAAPEAVVEAVRKTRAETGYVVRFESVTRAQGAAFTRKGVGRRCGPGVLILDFDEGGKAIRAVRAGDRSWVYDPLVGKWMAPDEAGETGVTYGLQNPDDVLRLIGEEAAAARPKGPDLEIALEGAKAVALAKKLIPNQDVDVTDLTVTLKRDGSGRIVGVAVEVAAKGGAFNATFDLGGFGKVEVPEALGPAGSRVPLSAPIRAAIQAELQR